MTTNDTQGGCSTTGVPTPACWWRVIALLMAGFWSAGALGGVWMIVEDMRDRSEMFDGLGQMIGVLAVLVCLALAIPWWIAYRRNSTTWAWIAVVTSAAMGLYLFLGR